MAGKRRNRSVEPDRFRGSLRPPAAYPLPGELLHTRCPGCCRKLAFRGVAANPLFGMLPQTRCSGCCRKPVFRGVAAAVAPGKNATPSLFPGRRLVERIGAASHLLGRRALWFWFDTPSRRGVPPLGESFCVPPPGMTGLPRPQRQSRYGPGQERYRPAPANGSADRPCRMRRRRRV